MFSPRHPTKPRIDGIKSKLGCSYVKAEFLRAEINVRTALSSGERLYFFVLECALTQISPCYRLTQLTQDVLEQQSDGYLELKEGAQGAPYAAFGYLCDIHGSRNARRPYGHARQQTSRVIAPNVSTENKQDWLSPGLKKHPDLSLSVEVLACDADKWDVSI